MFPVPWHSGKQYSQIKDMQQRSMKMRKGQVFDIQGWHRYSNREKPNREELTETWDQGKRRLAAAFEIWNQWNVGMAVTALCPANRGRGPNTSRTFLMRLSNPDGTPGLLGAIYHLKVFLRVQSKCSQGNFHPFSVQWICLRPLHRSKGFHIDIWVRKMPNTQSKMY